MRVLIIALLCLGSLVLGACGPTSPTASPVATSPPQANVVAAAPRAENSPSTTMQPGASLEACAVPAVTSGQDTVVVQLTWHCGEQPHTVTRDVPNAADTEQLLVHTLEALLAGPTEAERAAGLQSWFSPATAGKLNDVTLNAQGHATVDFATFSALIPNASTSAGSTMLLAELRQTVFQFSEVQSVTFQFDGSCDAFWNWLQMSCQQVSRA